jgi:hypothetical protein
LGPPAARNSGEKHGSDFSIHHVSTQGVQAKTPSKEALEPATNTRKLIAFPAACIRPTMFAEVRIM